MKGVKRQDLKRYEERCDFARSLFVSDCQNRANRGFVDAPLSIPGAQKLFKRQYGVTMNSQRIYIIRGEVFQQFSLDHNGRPVTSITPQPIPVENGVERQAKPPELPPIPPPSYHPKDNSLNMANRDPSDPQFHVAVVGTPDKTYGAFFRDGLLSLQEKGMISANIKVSVDHPRYISITDYPSDK